MRLVLVLLALPALIIAEDKPKPKLGGGNVTSTGSLPPSTTTLANKAATAFSKQDWKTARQAYREMLELDPENALTWANLGAVEQQSKNADAAVACFEASVRFNSALVQSWTALGLLYSAKGDRYKAVSAYARAIHEDPTDARAHNYLAIEAQSLGWTDTALSELQRAIEINPDYGLAHFNLAAMYLDQKPPSKTLARKHYDKALALGVEKDEVIESKLVDR
jgi:tetratricopeptide (TPR) repeat protein